MNHSIIVSVRVFLRMLKLEDEHGRAHPLQPGKVGLFTVFHYRVVGRFRCVRVNY